MDQLQCLMAYREDVGVSFQDKVFEIGEKIGAAFPDYLYVQEMPLVGGRLFSSPEQKVLLEAEVKACLPARPWRHAVGFSAFLKKDSAEIFQVLSVEAVVYYLPAIMLNLLFFGDLYKNVLGFRCFFAPLDSQLSRFLMNDVSEPIRDSLGDFHEQRFWKVQASLCSRRSKNQKEIVSEFVALYFGEMYAGKGIDREEIDRIAHIWKTYPFPEEYRS